MARIFASISVQCHFLAVYSDAADGILNVAFDPVRQSSGLQLGATQGTADKSIFVRYVIQIAAKLGKGQGALHFSRHILKSSPTAEVGKYSIGELRGHLRRPDRAIGKPELPAVTRRGV
jgi:hypothetical protein